MTVVIAPASFKGSLTARAAAEAMAAGVRDAWPQARTLLLPMADGGEGTLDAIEAALGGERATIRAAICGGVSAEATLLWPRRDTAVIESAQLAGLAQCLARGDVWQRHSGGVGTAIVTASARGARVVYIGVGGTGVNDGGAGLLHALGARYYDAQNAMLAPTPRELRRLARVTLPPRLDVELIALCDVDAPLCGRLGATAVFGPQKGVADRDIERLDAVLAHFGALCDAALGMPSVDAPGSGAGGGIGYALRVVGARFTPGAKTIGELLGLPQAIAGATLVLTGEGRFDAQTLQGKAPWRVAQWARAAGVPVLAVCGSVAPDAKSAFDALGALTELDAAAAAPAPAAARVRERTRRLVANWRQGLR